MPIVRLRVSTAANAELRDITSHVRDVVKQSGVSDGICIVFVPHTTAGVIINENADPDVARDIVEQLGKLVPSSGSYRHREGNAPGHIKASLVGNSEMLFVERGELVLGTWQGIFFCEFDGPRQRTVMVKVIASQTPP